MTTILTKKGEIKQIEQQNVLKKKGTVVENEKLESYLTF
jgi:hypothetical protein